MTIVPDHLIEWYCKPDGSEPEPLITPFDAKRVQPASYDLTLGNEFITFEQRTLPIAIDLSDPPKSVGTKRVLQEGEFLRLDPLKFILGVTRETICLPSHIAAKLDGKSSLARFGLLIHVTGGFVDPGFRGPLTLEIFNVFPVPILLRPGIPFCQIGFQELSASARKPYTGRYQDAKGVEASKYDWR